MTSLKPEQLSQQRALLCVSRKRKLPASFSLAEEARAREAARLIQRLLRLRWALGRLADPVSLERIPLRHAFCLFEPASGVTHWFDARSFASYVLATACFHNPLTRREMHSWEVGRLVRSQPRLLRDVIRGTFQARHALQKFAYESEGMDLASSVVASIDTCLQDMLKVAELNFFDFSLLLVQDLLEAYEDLLLDLHSFSTEKARAACVRHRAVMEKRGLLCPEELLGEVKLLHSHWEQSRREEAEERAPVPLLKEWVLQRLKFR
jgi:hypothetical protein